MHRQRPRGKLRGSPSRRRWERVAELLKEQDAEDIVLVVGGIIPDRDVERLRKLGVDAIFPPGTTTTEIIEFIQKRTSAVAA